MNAKKNRYFKIGLVVVLALVFIAALANSVISIRRSPPPPPPPRNVAAARQPSTAHTPVQPVPPLAAAQSSAAAMPQANNNRTWPRFELEQIIAYDPFASGNPAQAVAADPAQSGTPGNDSTPRTTKTGKEGTAKRENDLESRIYAVYQRGGNTAALVGSRTMRPGDQIEGTGRIVEVDQGGVMLEVRK